MNDGLEKIIINAKGIPNKESKDLLALVDLMINKPVHLINTLIRFNLKLKKLMTTRNGGIKLWTMRPNYLNANKMVKNKA